MTSDRKTLKIEALLQKISSIVTNYENQVADLRVEVTVLTEEVNRLQSELDEEKEKSQQDTAD